MLVHVMTNGHAIFPNGGMTWEHLGFALLLGLIGVVAINLPYWKPKGPVVECQATVKSKRVESSNTPAIYYRGERSNYVITFVVEDGKEVDLVTIPAIYADLKEGDTGRLKYQRDSILEFELL
ncbi:MAG: DUF2500 family protein [Agathobacter sp.]|nr:DUF2500 family protein [Agathobacter sp.]MBQ2902682.1 DUF2500 family protein [Agathobacter sp.]